MGALSLVGSVTSDFGALKNDVTPSVPIGSTDDDIVFCLIGCANSTAPSSVPSGWSLLESYTTDYAFSWLYYTIANGTISNQWDWSAYTKRRGTMIALRGVDTADAIEDSGIYHYGGDDDQLIPNSVTTANNGCTLLYFGSVRSISVKSCTAPTALGTWTEDFDDGDTDSDISHYIYRIRWGSSGASGNVPATLSASVTNDRKMSYLVALNPLASSGVNSLLLGGGF